MTDRATRLRLTRASIALGGELGNANATWLLGELEKAEAELDRLAGSIRFVDKCRPALERHALTGESYGECIDRLAGERDEARARADRLGREAHDAEADLDEARGLIVAHLEARNHEAVMSGHGERFDRARDAAGRIEQALLDYGRELLARGGR